MRRHIALYINLDMVASPNFARFVQGAAATGDGLAAVVRRELLADFREHNLSVEERAEGRSEEHTSELQSHLNLVCRLLLEKKKKLKSDNVDITLMHILIHNK